MCAITFRDQKLMPVFFSRVLYIVTVVWVLFGLPRGLAVSPWLAGTHFADQASFCPQKAEIKGVCHHIILKGSVSH